MFQTTLSPASTKAASLTGTEMGLVTSSTTSPILCAAGLGKAFQVASKAGQAATYAGQAVDVATGVADAVGDVAGDAIDAVGDFFSSIFYLSPGRMPAAGTQVAENASVEELISVSRGGAV